MNFLPYLNTETLIRTLGYIGIFSILFSESGILIGFFLPGDSLLFTAGFLASQGFLNLFLLCIVTFAAAVLGDSFGYSLGSRFGPRVFRKDHSIFFDKSYIERSQVFFKKHGGKAIVLARFIPVVRTITPILAGTGKMPYTPFLFYNVAGGAIWTVGLAGLGFWLGSIIPNIDHYLLPIVGAIIFISIAPGIFHVIRNPERRQRLFRRH